MLGRASWRRGRPKDELNGVLRKGDLGGGKEVRRPGEKKIEEVSGLSEAGEEVWCSLTMDCKMQSGQTQKGTGKL